MFENEYDTAYNTLYAASRSKLWSLASQMAVNKPLVLKYSQQNNS